MKFLGKIFWSADVSKKLLLETVKRKDFPRDEVGVKLDRKFLLEHGPEVIRELQEEHGVAVFADTKVIEVPRKVAQIVDEYLVYKPHMLNVQAGICNTGVSPQEFVQDKTKTVDTLRDFAAACALARTRSCVVTILTSKTPELVRWEHGLDAEAVARMCAEMAVEYHGEDLAQALMALTPQELQQRCGIDVAVMVAKYARLAAECGVTDIVCSPREAQYLRENGLPPEVTLNTPGVRLPGSDHDDQQRVMSPGEALKAGADRLVIGNDLTRGLDEGGDFMENYERVKADIAKWR